MHRPRGDDSSQRVPLQLDPGTDDLSSFDVLPAKLAGIYAKTGVRPDLLYDLAAGPLAGEARGRRRDHKQMFPTGKGTPAQKARLEKLAQWSVDHDDHAYFMSWVWLGAGGVYVDIFLPDGSPAAASLKTEWIDTPGSTPPGNSVYRGPIRVGR